MEMADTSVFFGEPELVPRFGDDYQVEIPALMRSDEYDSYLKTPIDAENRDHVPFDFLVGLPVPIMCINNLKGMVKIGEEKQDFSVDSVEGFSKNASSMFESRKKIDPEGGPSYLVPGVSGDSWNDIERESFLLGLYIFPKKFTDLKRFVECKSMEDILLFYYGEFYKSIEHSRWSFRRKTKSPKCVYGEQLFTSLRQQKLLSRLLPQVSEGCRKALLEVSEKFSTSESKMSLQEYVSSIKAMVGIKSFFEAISIAKGKHDLTGLAIEPVKSNQASNMHQEIPVGKACASLTHAEIVKYLTGGYRLSKARSNDLFWEAVWPRLLARGWHSEQPTNHPYIPGATHSLVFLTPGITEFSKWELEKGNHYFDSITDVLSKVGSEPELIESETKKDEGNKSEGYGLIQETMEEERLPEKHCHSYLEPRTARCSAGVMEYTIVDTSLSSGKKFKARKVRNLPMDTLKTTILSENSDQGTSEISTNVSDCAHNMSIDAPWTEQKFDSRSEQAAQGETNSRNHIKILSDRGMIFDRKDFASSSSGRLIDGLDSTEPVKKSRRQNNLYEDKQTRKGVQSHLSQLPKQYDLDNLSSVPKRQRKVNACSNKEIISDRSAFPLLPKVGEDVYGSCSDSHEPADRALSQVGSSRESLSLSWSQKDSSPPSNGAAQDDDCQGNPQGVSHFHTLIDLNLPAQPFDFENGVFLTNLMDMQDVTAPQQPDNMNSRRQSTRNRPPTARALEALADGYLTPTRRRKDSDAREPSTLRPPRRSRVSARQVKTMDHVLAGGGGTDGGEHV